MRALITGAAGFVGHALSNHLIEAGDSVVALSRNTSGPDVTDRESMFRVVAENEPDAIFHLAAQAHVPTSWSDPIGTLRTNVEGTQNVIDAAHAAGPARVIIVTSAEVYGAVDEADLPISEDAPMRPANPYAASKVAADAVAQQAHLGRGQDVIRLRSFNHFGPGQSPQFVCAGIAHRIAAVERGTSIDVEVGALDIRRDFSDVRDIASAYRLVAMDGHAGEVYNVCSGIDRSIREIAEGLAALSTEDIVFRSREELLRLVDTPIVRGDRSKLTSHTGWVPQRSLEETLADVLDDARLRINSNQGNTPS